MSNGHVALNRKDSKGIAIIEVNTLSEDDHHVNPADHDGKKYSIEFLFQTQRI